MVSERGECEEESNHQTLKTGGSPTVSETESLLIQVRLSRFARKIDFFPVFWI